MRLPLSVHIQAQVNDPSPLILYHGKRCPDGFAAALAAWIFYQGQAEFIGLDHGQIQTLADLPPLSGRCIYILDFCLPKHLLQEIDQVAQKLVLLDHHQSACDQMGDFQCCARSLIHFDMKKSGARLAWEFFFPNDSVPEFIAMIEDRDLWRWELKDSAAFLSALDLIPQEFPRWNELLNLSPEAWNHWIVRGQAMNDQFQHLATEIAEQARPIVFNGHSGLMVNAPSAFHSLVGNMLCQKSGTFAVIWTINSKGELKLGLRALAPFNVIPLAQSLGGGGHPQASGCRLPIERLPELLSGVFSA